MITTLAGTGSPGYGGDGGPATAAQLNHPCGVAVDDAGTLYIIDDYNDRVRQVTPDGVITTMAGTGRSGYSVVVLLDQGKLVRLANETSQPVSEAVFSCGGIGLWLRPRHPFRQATSSQGKPAAA
jgi:DNA-binding beta-propeller fold protein YncE